VIGRVSIRHVRFVAAVLCLLTASLFAAAAQNPDGTRGNAVPAPATLGLEQGTLEFDPPDFERGAFTIPLQKATRWLELTDEVQ